MKKVKTTETASQQQNLSIGINKNIEVREKR